MPKYFLYIDESKDFKNHTLYLGGLVSFLSFGMLENFCLGCAIQQGHGELKSTFANDRDFFEKLLKQKDAPFTTFVEKIVAHSDQEYLNSLIDFTEKFLASHPKVDALEIIADFTRLNRETRQIEKIFSRKLTHQFQIPINFSFKNSSKSRVIQFADLAVGIYRRQKKAPSFDVSQSKSKTTLRIHSGGAVDTV